MRENCPCCRDAPCQEQEGGWKEPNLPAREGLLSPTLIPPDLGTALGLPWGSALDFPGGQHPERWSCCPGLLHGPRPRGFHLSPQTAGSAHPVVAEGTNGSHGKGGGGPGAAPLGAGHAWNAPPQHFPPPGWLTRDSCGEQPQPCAAGCSCSTAAGSQPRLAPLTGTRSQLTLLILDVILRSTGTGTVPHVCCELQPCPQAWPAEPRRASSGYTPGRHGQGLVCG